MRHAGCSARGAAFDRARREQQREVAVVLDRDLDLGCGALLDRNRQALALPLHHHRLPVQRHATRGDRQVRGVVAVQSVHHRHRHEGQSGDRLFDLGAKAQSLPRFENGAGVGESVRGSRADRVCRSPRPQHAGEQRGGDHQTDGERGQGAEGRGRAAVGSTGAHESQGAGARPISAEQRPGFQRRADRDRRRHEAREVEPQAGGAVADSGFEWRLRGEQPGRGKRDRERDDAARGRGPSAVHGDGERPAHDALTNPCAK